MGLLDYVIIFVLIAFFGLGFWRGFVSQALGLVAIAAAFYLAVHFHVELSQAGAIRKINARSPSAALVVAFMIIFFPTVAVGSIAARLIGNRIQRTILNGADRWLGGAIGLVKAAMLLGAVALGLQEWGLRQGAAVPPDPEEIADGNLIVRSRLIPYFAEWFVAGMQLIPQSAREQVERFVKHEAQTHFGLAADETVPPGSSQEPATLPESSQHSDLATVMRQYREACSHSKQHGR